MRKEFDGMENSVHSLPLTLLQRVDEARTGKSGRLAEVTVADSTARTRLVAQDAFLEYVEKSIGEGSAIVIRNCAVSRRSFRDDASELRLHVNKDFSKISAHPDGVGSTPAAPASVAGSDVTCTTGATRAAPSHRYADRSGGGGDRKPYRGGAGGAPRGGYSNSGGGDSRGPRGPRARGRGRGGADGGSAQGGRSEYTRHAHQEHH